MDARPRLSCVALLSGYGLYERLQCPRSVCDGHGRIKAQDAQSQEEEGKRQHVCIAPNAVDPLPCQCSVPKHKPVCHLWSLPPLIGVVLRPTQASGERYPDPEHGSCKSSTAHTCVRKTSALSRRTATTKPTSDLYLMPFSRLTMYSQRMSAANAMHGAAATLNTLG